MKKLFPSFLVLLALGITAGLLIPAFRHGPRHPKSAVCKIDIRTLTSALSLYFEFYTRYPSGGNAEIIKKLRGDNPQHIECLSVGPNSLNEKGEFLDPWQTPFQMQIMDNAVHIRSAGENKLFGDADDITSDQKD